MKILLVDDQASNRALLSFILEDEGFTFVHAANGIEACEQCRHDRDISLILMDVTMPEMDGLTAARLIKEEHEARLIPIIFVTALDDAEVLAQCLEAGGDDFVPKPVNESVLLAKIKAHKRTASLYDNLQRAHKQLEYHQKMVDREHAIVERMFRRCADRVSTDCLNLRTYTSPKSMFNGDIVLEAPSPHGGVYALLGDFTGHGLAASIGTLPVSEIFFRLAAKQASISLFAKTINKSLMGLLPDNMFFCACIAYLDPQGASLSLWAGGMNDVVCVPADPQAPLRLIPSQHMPLGILTAEEFDDSPLVLDLRPGDRIFMFTDGLNETQNANGEELGIARVHDCLAAREKDAVNGLLRMAHRFRGEDQQSDDISLIEMRSGPLCHVDKCSGVAVDIAAEAHTAKSFPWTFSMRLQNEELRNTSIVDQLMVFVSGIQGIEMHREKIFTIVSELYSNALEHGVLRLDSKLKDSADGFAVYYQLRQERLERIEGQFIDLNVSFHKGECSKVCIDIADSGDGFDHQAVLSRAGENESAFGRGFSLLRTLCKSLEFDDGGRRVRASYVFCIDNCGLGLQPVSQHGEGLPAELAQR